MELTDDAFQRLLGMIYEAVEDPRRWRAFYEALCPVVGVTSVHMLALDNRNGTLSYSEGANLPVQGELAYMQKYHALDPRVPLIRERAVHAWTHCHQELDESFVARDPFYQDFLLPYDRRYLSGTKLLESGDAQVIFCTLSSPAQGPLGPAGIAFLDRLLPHLSRAVRLSLQNFVYSTQALVGHLMVNKLRQPVILASPGGEVMHTNEAARQLLQSTDLVRIEDGRVRLPAEYESELFRRFRELESGIKRAGSDGAPELEGQFQSMHIQGPARGAATDSLYAFFSLLLPQTSMGAFGLRPIIMLIFYHPESAPVIDSSLLFAVFGLTPAESRVASLLAQGLSLKEIASVQGTQHETIRKQLRSIYQKTSTNRQPDLVRLLLHLPHHAVKA